MESDKIDEFMLPGFRFHPTDEELVGFYLRRKIRQKPLSIELIKQLDIYKYDPWDLPNLATTGEKELYFYCPRDRKYRNSTRPNRVTRAGFWKATGTDRPVYSSESSKCIGLKKSLVFYKGRAAKGIKTDWMMHEFRLPSVSDSVSAKRYIDKDIPANEAWTVCRIFNKANSRAQRALSHSLVYPVFDEIKPINGVDNIQFSCSTITTANETNTPLPFCFSNISSAARVSPTHFPPCKPAYHSEDKHSNGDQLMNPSCRFSSTETSEPAAPKCAINDASSLLLDMSTSMLGDLGRGSQISMFDPCCRVSEDMQVKGLIFGHVEEPMRSVGNQYSLPDAWNSNLLWDSCPSPTEFYTNNCYTLT